MKALLTLFSIAVAASGLANITATGALHSCAWDGQVNTKIQCWGYPYYGFNEKAPIVENLIDMQAGAWHVCALSVDSKSSENSADFSTNIHCWGESTFGQTAAPRYSDLKPVRLSVGQWHNCAVFESLDSAHKRSISCWGREDTGQTLLGREALEGPLNVYAGVDYSCASHKRGSEVLCVGAVKGRFPTERFANFNPRDRHMECERVGGDVSCWTYSADLHEGIVKKNGPLISCNFNRGQLTCVDRGTALKIFDQALETMQSFDVGKHHVCYINHEGINCLHLIGGGNFGQADPSTASFRFGPHFRSIDDLDNFLYTLSRDMHKFDRDVVENALNIARSLNLEGRASLLQVIEPFVSQLRYEKITTDYLPAYAVRIRKYLEATGPSNLERGHLLGLLVTTLVSSKRFIGAKAARAIEDVIFDLGKLEVSGIELAALPKEKLGAIKEHLIMNNILSNRVDLIETIEAQWGE